MSLLKTIKHLVPALLLPFVCSCTRSGSYIVSDGAMIGTTFHVCAEAENMTPAQLYAEMMRIESEARASMSIFDENSLLNRLNRNETDSLDLHILRNLTIARNIAERIDNRYDITVKPLTEAFGFAASKAVARPDTDSLLAFVGYDKWRIENGRVVKTDPRVQFDLNSVAKGYTVDMAARMLEEHGSKNYLVEIGGEVRCRGVNRSGEMWTIGIDAPYDGNMSPGADMCGAVMLGDKSLATSGNYRRFHIDGEGRKIVHTIDPRTGHGIESRLLSATVVAATCAEADALATMFMAVGADDALALAERMRDTVGVFFILDRDGEYEFFNTIDNPQ
ncbi:MAG: FAD:protein FMN transferase [Alistipes sp.]|nr:FAD:protein FMN transferase [Alistipes sp.]